VSVAQRRARGRPSARFLAVPRNRDEQHHEHCDESDSEHWVLTPGYARNNLELRNLPRRIGKGYLRSAYDRCAPSRQRASSVSPATATNNIMKTATTPIPNMTFELLDPLKESVA
jgi:hypothetical protein